MQASFPLTSLVLICAAVSAADSETVTQLRLSLGSAPGISKAKEETSVFGSSITNDVTVKSDVGGNIELGIAGYRFAPDNRLGFGGYAGIFARNQAGKDETGVSVSAASVGVNLGVDVAMRPDPNLLLTIGPRLGLGVVNQHIGAPEYQDANGVMVAFGVQAGVYGTIRAGSGNVVLGLEIGGMGWSSKAQHQYDDGAFRGTIDETFSGSGGYAALVVGHSF